MFVLHVFPQKRQLYMKIAVWFPWFYQIFRKTSTTVIVVSNNVSNIAQLLWRQNVRSDIIHSMN